MFYDVHAQFHKSLFYKANFVLIVIASATLSHIYEFAEKIINQFLVTMFTFLHYHFTTSHLLHRYMCYENSVVNKLILIWIHLQPSRDRNIPLLLYYSTVGKIFLSASKHPTPAYIYSHDRQIVSLNGSPSGPLRNSGTETGPSRKVNVL